MSPPVAAPPRGPEPDAIPAVTEEQMLARIDAAVAQLLGTCAGLIPAAGLLVVPFLPRVANRWMVDVTLAIAFWLIPGGLLCFVASAGMRRGWRGRWLVQWLAAIWSLLPPVLGGLLLP